MIIYFISIQNSLAINSFSIVTVNTLLSLLHENNVSEYDDNGEFRRRTGWDTKLYRATEDSLKEVAGLTFTAETDDDYGRKPIEYLCWQKCEWEDDYRGYLLFPMKDGRYWCVYFQM